MAYEHRREQAVFESARSIADRAAREAYLVEACAGDAALLGRVAHLLRALEEEPSFLESPATAVANVAETARESALPDQPLAFLQPTDEPGALGRLGHYTILHVVGSGGLPSGPGVTLCSAALTSPSIWRGGK